MSSNYIQIIVIFQSVQTYTHLIPKWRIVVTWLSMPRFRAALPRSSRVTAILELDVYT